MFLGLQSFKVIPSLSFLSLIYLLMVGTLSINCLSIISGLFSMFFVILNIFIQYLDTSWASNLQGSSVFIFSKSDLSAHGGYLVYQLFFNYLWSIFNVFGDSQHLCSISKDFVGFKASRQFHLPSFQVWFVSSWWVPCLSIIFSMFSVMLSISLY
jgi:hypothetical protein